MNKLVRPIKEKITYFILSILFFYLIFKNINNSDYDIRVILYFLVALMFFVGFVFSLKIPQIEIKNNTVYFFPNLIEERIRVKVIDIKRISKMPNNKGVLVELDGAKVEFKPYWSSNKNIKDIYDFLTMIMEMKEVNREFSGTGL